MEEETFDLSCGIWDHFIDGNIFDLNQEGILENWQIKKGRETGVQTKAQKCLFVEHTENVQIL